MIVTSSVASLPPARVVRHLTGLPVASGYAVTVVPLEFDEQPFLSGWTHFDHRRITLEIPEPFVPFGEVVPYAARRRSADGELRFTWLTEGITFRTPREVLRFLYLHEWMHWYLGEVLGKKSRAETACDRFALWHYRRKAVSTADAEAALRRRPPGQVAAATSDEVTQLGLWSVEEHPTPPRSPFPRSPATGRPS